MTSIQRLFRVLLLTLAATLPFSLLRAQEAPPQLEEKVGQTVHFADSSTGPGAPHSDYKEQTIQGHVGSFENITGAAETNALQKLAVEKSRLHIPLVFAL